MITHDMGDTPPPVFGFGKPQMMRTVELEIIDQSGEKHHLATLIPYGPGGMPVHDKLQSEYWCSHKMHVESELLCKKYDVKFPPGAGMFDQSGKLVGVLDYRADDTAYERAWIDCFAREIAATNFDIQAMIGLTYGDGVPQEALHDLAVRTGAPVMAKVMP